MVMIGVIVVSIVTVTPALFGSTNIEYNYIGDTDTCISHNKQNKS